MTWVCIRESTHWALVKDDGEIVALVMCIDGCYWTDYEQAKRRKWISANAAKIAVIKLVTDGS